MSNFLVRNKRVLIISGIILTAGIGVWLLARNVGKKEEKIDEGNLSKEKEPVSIVPTNPSLANANDKFPLLKGSKGANVQLLQAYLNILKASNLVMDGDFGAKTESALLAGYKIKGVTEANMKAFLGNLRATKGLSATPANADAVAINYLKQYIINQGVKVL